MSEENSVTVTQKKRGRPRAAKKVEDFSQAIADTSAAQSYRVPTAEAERTSQIAEKEKKNIIRIQPTRRIKTGVTAQAKFEKDRERAWEYVTGVFENNVMIGHPITFWLSGLPGDDYCEWTIPANKPLEIPRYVANHLANKMKYCTFRFRPRNDANVGPGDFLEVFEPDVYQKRGSFIHVSEF